MNDLKSVMKCTYINLARWFGSNKSLAVMAVSFVFSYYVYFPVTRIALRYKLTVPPSLFVFYLSHFRMAVLHGGMSVFLFSDVVENDEYAYWNIQRTGRSVYIAGQCIYVLILSFIYTLFLVLLSLIMTAPVLHSFKEWGTMCYTLGENLAELTSQTGMMPQIIVSTSVLRALTPLAALLYAILFMWLDCSFLGMIILFFTVLANRMTGIIITGILIGMSMFSLFGGLFMFGPVLRYLSPVTWSNIAAFNWGNDTGYPTSLYAGLVLTVGIILMGSVSCIRYTRKDIG